MPPKPDTKLLLRRHKSMLIYQQTISPFTPTIRELGKVWGLNSTHTVSEVLSRLVKLGLVMERKRESHKQYYAIDNGKH